MESGARRIIKNLQVLPELGRQRCFELGNPFYYQDAAEATEPGNEQGNYYRKELRLVGLLKVDWSFLPGTLNSILSRILSAYHAV